MADAISTPLEKSLVWKLSQMCGENIGFFIIKQIKKIPLCSVEQLGHGEKHSTFPYTSFMLYNFLRALQQNRNTSGNLVGEIW